MLFQRKATTINALLVQQNFKSVLLSEPCLMGVGFAVGMANVWFSNTLFWLDTDCKGVTVEQKFHRVVVNQDL